MLFFLSPLVFFIGTPICKANVFLSYLGCEKTMQNNYKDDDAPVTDVSLLRRLATSGTVTRNQAWFEFFDKYKLLVWKAARSSRYKFSQTEAEDITVNVMKRISEQFLSGKFVFEPNKGQFRFYLRTIIKNCCIDAVKARSRNLEDSTDAIEDIPSDQDESFEKAFDYQYARLIFECALADFVKEHANVAPKLLDIASLLCGYDRQKHLWLKYTPTVSEIQDMLEVTADDVYNANRQYVKDPKYGILAMLKLYKNQ